MFIARHYKIFISILVIMVLLVVGILIWQRPPLSIEFTGGSVLEVSYQNQSAPAQTTIEQVAKKAISSNEVTVRSIGNDGWSLTTPYLSQADHETLVSALSFDNKYQISEDRFSSVGPSVGQEMKRKALVALGLVVLGIIIFVAIAFHKVSRPVSSWLYGLSAAITLVHDILIPIGVFAIFSMYTTMQIDVLFVTALLAIFGFSVSDTIVVFDRVRENLRKNHEAGSREVFEEVVGRSLTQTYGRSINTSLTTAIALAALYVFGGPATHNFALVLLIGIISGTYSSILLASPLLIFFSKIFHGKAV